MESFTIYKKFIKKDKQIGLRINSNIFNFLKKENISMQQLLDDRLDQLLIFSNGELKLNKNYSVNNKNE